ncbi:TFIIB-type zinc ribbon-containing protein [Sporanaerobacter acetigenes]|uniref:Replication restart DNA helicase PriA n=1 Tax=Sporanaerobacter acetigenes DSM 13106 TaxID=1123281 RepID=A0A1M5SNP5_9FIRM|nr:TFIIB-type zinc ribbon-containing protein [Sporanaerobacter acetigenes]SHH39908.1 replication restart DNA helicase PriA [Sporanaerobacter acetigenes DSM 13106]
MLIHYKCPNCGSDMVFDSNTGKLKCNSCGREDDIEGFSDEFITRTFSEEDGKEYHCKNCGAVIITEAETTATTCSFCGAAVVLGDRLSGTMAPSKVIPFKISKKQAEEAFKSWCKNGLLTPKGFMTADRVKKITGMYVPFWLYDLNSRVEVNAVGTKIREYTSGDYIYTETRYYDVYRDINLDYIKVPVDASEKMNDELMDKLEPYNYTDLKEFKTPYLAGYIAEKYNYDESRMLPRAKDKIENYIQSYINSTIMGYSSVRFTNKHIDTSKKNAYYTLLPVWMVYYDYEDSEHVFAMNGQTGKVVGKPPISYKKVAAWFGGIAGFSFIILKLISIAIGGGLW